MTNIRFTKKSRHPRRNRGENSLGQNEQEENKYYSLNDSEVHRSYVKENRQLENKKQIQLNFK
jgi:hypothetical protein